MLDGKISIRRLRTLSAPLKIEGSAFSTIIRPNELIVRKTGNTNNLIAFTHGGISSKRPTSKENCCIKLVKDNVSVVSSFFARNCSPPFHIALVSTSYFFDSVDFEWIEEAA